MCETVFQTNGQLNQFFELYIIERYSSKAPDLKYRNVHVISPLSVYFTFTLSLSLQQR